MFFLVLPALGTILETVGTIILSTVVAEMASDAYRALTSSNDHDKH
jgi:hypothetical protein